MWFPFPNPILAVEFGGIVCVATIVMMFVGWIMNLVNNKNRPAPAARRPPQPGEEDDRVQSEIDNFLQQVGGGKRRVETEQLDELAIELVSEEEQAQRPRRQRPQSTPPKHRSQPLEPVDTPLSERHLETSVRSSDVGAGLREHQQQFAEHDHISNEVDRDLGRRSRGHRLKPRATSQPDVEQATSRGTAASMSSGIVHILRNPATVRQAILISEILSPPKSRRR